jgi:dermatan/chondrotin sulfate uronyl 2-O-sulfotransferase UST
MKIVYNRIGKAGSSSMIHLLESLSQKNHFYLHNAINYHPSKPTLTSDLAALKPFSVYINHANFLLGTSEDTKWINVVRNPISRWSSLYYYEVDVKIRGNRAKEALTNRFKDQRCGCYGLEFYECIEMRFNHGCDIEIPSQIWYFCEPGETCNRTIASSRCHSDYTVVGLLEELRLTVKMLEKLLPLFFRNASHASQAKKRSTSLTNSLTNPTMTGAVPDRGTNIIKEHAVNYEDEMGFYDDVTKLFWKKACELNLLSSSD